MTDDGIVVIDGGDAEGPWEPTTGSVTLGLRTYLLNDSDLPEESVENVLSEARDILRQCLPPTHRDRNRTGLVCGYVQSGKTASMTAVSALASDNRYRIVILLAGVTTNLVDQNRGRLEEDLRAAAAEWNWLMFTNPKPNTSLRDLQGLVEEWQNDSFEESDRRTLFISVMKNHHHLDNLAGLLSQVDLSGAPAIIFDDEADQASLDTRPNMPTSSTTYVRIDALRRALPSHTYLQYTATPQAPLLIARIDTLSADFAELVSPGEAYTGGQTFFGQPNDFVETIPLTEIFRDGQLPLEPPVSLQKALRLYLVGVTAGRIAGERKHRSMLVHPSRARATHRTYADWVERLKSAWGRLLQDDREPDRPALVAEFRAAYDDLARTRDELPDFDAILRKLPVAMNQTSVTIVNSTDGREVPWRNAYAHILVGGEKLGRGYTVKGLTVTYMPRSPGGWTADTIQQRARFFGYHRPYLGFVRVFLHPDVRRVYRAYVEHEEDMRARLREHRGKPLAEWRRLFYLERRLAPTRRNVLSSQWFRPRLQEGWFAPRAPHASPQDGRHNEQLVRALLELDYQPDAEHARHGYAVVRLADVFERVLVPLAYHEEHDSLGHCVVNCHVTRMLDQNPDLECCVYLMDGGRPRLRRLTGGQIPQFFQGASSAGAQNYPGDRHFRHTSLPTLQIHVLRIEDQVTGQTYNQVPGVAAWLGPQPDMLSHED